jgi:hypothetical protein
MSILARIPWLYRGNKLADQEVRDVAEMLDGSRSLRRAENLRFTVKTRGKSPASQFGRDQLREAILHCVVSDEGR